MSTTVSVQYGTTYSWVGHNLNGMLDVFARDANGRVRHNWQTTPENNTWSGWNTLGTLEKASRLAVAPNRDGRLEIFAIFPTSVKGQGTVEHNWQNEPDNEYDWSGWKPLFQPQIGNPAVTQDADGRLEVFARNTDYSLEHAAQRPHVSGWFNAESLGGYLISNPVAAQDADGRLEIFARDRNDVLQHIWQTAPNNGWTKKWVPMPGGPKVAGFPATALNADGRMELFARSTDGILWHIWKTAANGGWSPAGWERLGDNVEDEPAVAANRDGRLEVFAIKDGALQHIWQKTLNDDRAWSRWEPLGGNPSGNLAVVRNHNAQLEVFSPFHDGTIRYIWQTTPDIDDDWSEWHSLGKP